MTPSVKCGPKPYSGVFCPAGFQGLSPSWGQSPHLVIGLNNIETCLFQNTTVCGLPNAAQGSRIAAHTQTHRE